MRRWEYKKIALSEVSRRRDEIDLLCDAGDEGWELVAILANNIAYLKREVVASVADAEERRHEEVPGPEPVEIDAPASNDAATAVKAKYRDPVTGDTWTGRGRMASWLKRKQDTGEDIEKYRV